MATIKLILGLFCLAAFGRGIMPQRHLLNQKTDKIVSIAEHELGVREATGNNDGSRVVQYLSYVNCRKGTPWCAAFVSWVFNQAGQDKPKSAWSPDLFPVGRCVKKVIPGLVFGIYFKEFGRIAHCGIVSSNNDKWISSIEGNTNVAGSRAGDGVYRKLRHIKTICKFAEWRSEKTVAVPRVTPLPGKEFDDGTAN